MRSLPHETINIDDTPMYKCMFQEWERIKKKPNPNKFCSERCKAYFPSTDDGVRCRDALLMEDTEKKTYVCVGVKIEETDRDRTGC